jgi:DNA-binding CsgD family transcriptional regulator
MPSDQALTDRQTGSQESARRPAQARSRHAVVRYHERRLTGTRPRQVSSLAHETATSSGTTGLLGKLLAWREVALGQIVGLTSREREIMDLVLAGQPSKNIAVDLGISRRTVENHRASIMKKTGSKSLPALARLVFTADWVDTARLSLAARSVVLATRAGA